MRPEKYKFCLTGLLVPVLLLASAAAAQALPADVQGHWAQPAIKRLINQGVLEGYPDRTFKPERSVTRAEFAHMAVKAFDLSSAETNQFSDTASHWASRDANALAKESILSGYADGTFRPDLPIGRADLITALNRLLRLGQKEQSFGQQWTATYTDVPRSQPAFRDIELARRLDYLPPAYGAGYLRPDAVVTRAEAAYMLDQVERLGRRQGTILEVNGEVGTLSIMTPEGSEPVSLTVEPDALVMRNNAEAALNQIQADDRIQAYVGTDGRAKVVAAEGKITANDLLSRLSTMSKGLLTPQTVASLARGDWSGATTDAKGVLFERLIAMGMGPGEAQSLLDQDWLTLDLLTREKLITALSTRLSLPPEIAGALLSQNLTGLKDMLQAQAANLGLSQLLQPPPQG